MTPLERRIAAATALDADPERKVAHDAKVARIRAALDRNRTRRLERITAPLSAAERFAVAEARNEAERFRNS